MQLTKRRSDELTIVPSEGAGRGHFLQPEWGTGSWGQGSLLERYLAVKPFLRGPAVLDLGCASRYGSPDWLHGLIAEEPFELVGLDIDTDKLASIRQAGFDVREGDVRNFDLGQQFDTVFAGELIEHLDDIRGFLSSVRRHLAPSGRLVMTTPNPFYVGNFIYRLGGHATVHPQHTCWFCEDTMRQVLRVNGFEAAEIGFTGHSSPTTARRVVSATARRVLPPRLALDTLLVVAQIADSQATAHASPL